MPAVSFHLARRSLSTGASAGIGIAIALIVLIVIGVIVFVGLKKRRAKHLAEIEAERAKWAGEKKKEEPPMPKRNKSIKDRLKGPLYQESFEMPQTKNRQMRASMATDGTPGSPHWEDVDGQPLTHKPWAESSPRPSFSSKRGTRIMMMM